MPINTLAYAQILQTTLDEAAVREMKTGWMDPNASRVKYNGGNEVKLPKMSTQGLGTYDRDSGYPQGSITLAWETHTMTQDRGRKFQLDSMDVDETAFVPTAAGVMGQFQREHVVPEIDAYRISKLASKAITLNSAGMVAYGQTISANSSTLRKVKEGIKAIREQGYNGALVIQANDNTKMELELELAGKLQNVTWSQGGINTTVPAVDGVPIIDTPANRMYTAITLYDGVTAASGNDPDQTIGGYVKGASAKDINFMILPVETPLAITKQDKMRIFDPNTFQKADAWSIDYRRYHDLWVLDNKVGSIYLSITQAAS
ncbi:MAG: hypothetical protein IKE58_10155 [Blautia sp.]|nr:hypothetical protein [Blautia sp.]